MMQLPVTRTNPSFPSELGNFRENLIFVLPGKPKAANGFSALTVDADYSATCAGQGCNAIGRSQVPSKM